MFSYTTFSIVIIVYPYLIYYGVPGGKKEQAQVKNRRALKDIGNFMTFPTIEGKISRPITRFVLRLYLCKCVFILKTAWLCRGFRAQLLSNAQLAAEKNKVVKQIVSL